MDESGLLTLLTPQALRLLDEIGEVPSTDAAAAAVARLRREGHAPDLVAAVVSQARLRTRAEAKFGSWAQRMLFTPAGLEQATRLEVAALHAARFRDAGMTRVADLGCGLGGDSLALAGLGIAVRAVDADAVTAVLAAYNLAPYDATVRHGRAEDEPLEDIDAVWLDPARRAAGHDATRRVGPDGYAPTLEWTLATAARIPAGVKLSPALDRSLIPADAEAQWTSVNGTLVELVIWTGMLARPGVRRAARVIRGGVAHELTAEADAPDAGVRDLGAYLHEPDRAVIRARQVGEVARMLDAGMLDPAIAYLTGDTPATSPFVQTFRVREELPFETRRLAAALRARGIGTLEIKKRGVDVDPARLRERLKLRGDEDATLILTRTAAGRHAILADRVVPGRTQPAE